MLCHQPSISPPSYPYIPKRGEGQEQERRLHKLQCCIQPRQGIMVSTASFSITFSHFPVYLSPASFKAFLRQRRWSFPSHFQGLPPKFSARTTRKSAELPAPLPHIPPWSASSLGNLEPAHIV